MKVKELILNRGSRVAAAFMILAIITVQSAKADTVLKLQFNNSAIANNLNYNKKARRLPLAKGIYLGRTKVNGKKRLGLVIEHKGVSWNVNNRGISVLKQF